MSDNNRRRPVRWIFAEPPSAPAVEELMRALSLPRELCQLLVLRGHATPSAAAAYLRPRLEALHHPSAMKGIVPAAERIARAIRDRELVLVHGDYDVDGISSTALMHRVLTEVGGRVVPFVPRRLTDGYDLTDAGVRAAISFGATLVITCDCGTSAHSSVEQLTRAGIDVIITDHHLPQPRGVPDCIAVVNPRQDGCSYPDKDLAGVGVAFKLLVQLLEILGVDSEIVHRYMDLVALATVADVAPLRGENRVLVRRGLKQMTESHVPGLRSLLRSSGLREKGITAGRVGFVLAPRLNAAGRLADAIRGVELLLAESQHEANAIARELEELNARRQEIDRATLESARDLIEGMELDSTYGIVLASDRWHSGVVGIVASRIVEEYGRPAVLIAVTGDEGKGSGRSVAAFDLHAGLSRCSGYLERFGGHRLAAGVTVRSAAIPDFAAAFNDVAREELGVAGTDLEVRVDIDIDIHAAPLDDIERWQRHFEPFGPANPAPVYVARGVTLARSPRKVGPEGLRLTVRSGGSELEMLGWSLAPRRRELESARLLDIAFRLERDDWNGMDRLQGRVIDFRESTA